MRQTHSSRSTAPSWQGTFLSVIATVSFCSMAHADAAGKTSIPDAVIQECNESASASELPDCLKNGAIAFEMLTMAQSEQFFGERASRVVAACRETNDTFYNTWVCFDVAVEKAAETQELIGVENIADDCVAGIADTELHTLLEGAYRAKRQAMFPDEMFFGGGMYMPFQGCD